MAPSRRKGAVKAAAVAAARRQWKVGDLVLAKVKGFPAWPAVVSEPEKWGYSTDWKKVLVFFFGTQQIAFCNPTDVESFTEEKKQSLLIKRQGKGADFVRAVQEIIDTYEKSKEHDKNDGGAAQANGGSIGDSSADLGSRVETGDPEGQNDLQLKSSCSTKDGDEPIGPVETASTSAQGRFLDKEALLEEPMDTNMVTEKPLPAMYFSRKRSGRSRSKISIVQRSTLAVQRPRCSSRMESRKLQKLGMPLNCGGKNSEELLANIIPGASLRWNKKIRNSPVPSDCEDVNSDAILSNGSIDDNGSEVVTVDSDTFSLNEGSTMDLDCKLENSETAIECLEGDVEFSKGLDLHIKAVVIKKKRRPTRKRIAIEYVATPDKEEGLGAVVDNGSQTSQNACENRTQRCSDEAGDEHLPLVKRARVRMGKSSSAEEESRKYSETEERNLKDATVNLSGRISKYSYCDDDSPHHHRDLQMVNGSLDAPSPLRDCTPVSRNGLQLCEFKKDQPFCSSVDGEAALPPSKRLHRALEAMSANATEENQAEMSVLKKTSVNGSYSSSMRISSHFPMDGEAGNSLGLQSVNPLGNNSLQSDALGSSTGLNPVVPDENAQTTLEVNICNESDGCRREVQIHELHNSDLQNDRVKDLCGLSPGCRSDKALVVIQSEDNRFPDLGSEKGNMSRSDHGTTDHMFSSNNEGTSISRSESPNGHIGTPDIPGMDLDPSSGANGIASLSPRSRTNVLNSCAKDNSYKDNKSVKPALGVNSGEKNMSALKEVNDEQSEKVQTSVSFSNDRLGEMESSGVRSSPSITDGGDSLLLASPQHNSICHISTSDSSNFLQNNSSCSPDVNLLYKRSLGAPVEDVKFESLAIQKLKISSKEADVHIALLSFEAMLGTLTRTKESIGRATRVAIDCAKLGLGRKVVEVLTRILEMESSLHKKLDLFFLVDSITQCSRNLKGNVAGIFCPAIQSVLPRVFSAVAPPGNTAQENRKQCLKVLRLWSQRGVLPESVIRHHMRELDSLSGSCSVGAYSRRSSRTERSLDDPLREMEGMLVDEYGSNSSFQLPGFWMPCMLKDEDEGSDSDGGSFEAVTPEHNSQACEEHETTPIIEKRRHILEDVDGELEMEDVAPPCEVEMSSSCSSGVVNAAENSHNQLEQHFPLHSGPTLPQVVPPSSPPLPASPPPPPPPLPPPTFARIDPYCNGVESKFYAETNNMQDNLVQSAMLQLDAPRYDPRTSDLVTCPLSECRDLQMQMQDSSGRSFSSFPMRPVNIIQEDSAALHSTYYPVRPPHPAPSYQFSYVQGDQSMKSPREGPSGSYSRRFHFAENMDGEIFYNNHERMRPAPYEPHENWRSSQPSFYGPRYPDRGRASYGPGPYSGPPCEPTRLPSEGWRRPPRVMNSRNSVPFRPPFQGPIPVSSRSPGYWHTR